MNIIMQIKDNCGTKLNKQKEKEFMVELNKIFKKYNVSGKF